MSLILGRLLGDVVLRLYKAAPVPCWPHLLNYLVQYQSSDPRNIESKMLNEHSKVSIAQIVFYSPAVIAATGLLFFRRPIRALPRFPWIVLLIFTLGMLLFPSHDHDIQLYILTRCFSWSVRLAGGIVVILYENQPSSNGLLIATLILLNVGVFPCIAATIGLINVM